MDRLSALIFAIALGACSDSKSTEPPPSRVNVAKTTKRQGTTVESFCDVYAPADKAQAFAWPKLTGAAPSNAASWRWVNVWASWCKPCVDEIPLLGRWREKLELDLVFVSIDESDDDIKAFKKTHPNTPATLRVTDSKAQEAWFVQLGLTSGTPIPVHVIVDAKQRVRCVRAGGVREKDLPVVEKLLAQ